MVGGSLGRWDGRSDGRVPDEGKNKWNHMFECLRGFF